MWQFLTFIIFIILIQKLVKTLQEQQKEQKEPTEEELRNYFQTLGLPLPEEIPPEPKPKRPKQPAIAKKEIKEPEIKVAELEPVKIEPLPKQAEEPEEELVTFSTDKLEEGIVLSVILGPSKANQTRRSGGIGIRA